MKTLLPFLLAPMLVHAATTIESANAYAYGANIGWINLRGDVTNGATVGEFICSGAIYSANCGWISLGSGVPANGIRYLNNSATDFGVNTQDYSANGITYEAKLRGYAYGANIGWINFEDTGNPRVNLATGQLLGYAYGANVGWIALSGTGVTVNTLSIAPGADADGDGIPDAWERIYASNLTTMNATTDRDGDGVLDQDEYATDTNPFDPNDRLRITHLVPPRQLVVNGPFMTDLAWTSKPTRKYSIEINPSLVSSWSGLFSSLIPDSGTTTTVRFADAQAGKRFYRVRAKLPLAP
ncbi:MAG: hypothetical protein WCF18_16105 [Chthoniobacteraceae bacterium]